MLPEKVNFSFFTRMTLASSVLAMAMWLDGWMDVCYTLVLCLNG